MSGGGRTAGDAWYAREAHLLDVARRALLRALRRPWRVIGYALLATAALVTLRALQAPTYVATIYFRVEEGTVSEGPIEQRAPRDIRQHIANVALSRHQLERIMRKHQWSEAWLELDREAAIDDFRSEIHVEVSRDYFIYPRRPGDPPRSAHVNVTLGGPDPEGVRAILREIGDAVLNAQAQERSGDLTEAARVLRAQLADARAQVGAVQERLGLLWTEAQRSNRRAAVAVEARIAALLAEHAGALRRVVALERRAKQVEFGTAVEGVRLGLTFAHFDEALAIRNPRLTRLQLARRAVATLVLCLLLTAAVVGAFDDRVHDPGDLTAHGLPFLGALPRFRGDDAPSCGQRTASAKG